MSANVGSGAAEKDATVLAEDAWERQWTEDQREQYMEELNEYDHPLFAEAFDTTSDTVRALQALADEDSTPADKARRLKEQGNTLFKQGMRYYGEAEKAYSEAATYASHTDPEDTDARQLYSTILSNRAAVNTALSHPARVVFDCERAIKLWAGNAKAYYRGAAALLKIGDAVRAEKMAERGVAVDAENAALQALLGKARIQALSQRRADMRSRREARAREAKRAEFIRQCAQRGVRVAPGAEANLAERQDQAYVDREGVLHWPVILLYPEHDQSDFVQDLPEDVPLAEVVRMLFPEGQFAPWDGQLRYRQGTVELFAATVGADGEPERWYKVPQECALAHLLRAPGYEVPGVPVLKVVARDTGFHESFTAALQGQVTELEATEAVRAEALE